MNDQDLRDNLEKFHHDSYGWALACCKSDHDIAADVLQTVYVKFLQRKAIFRQKSSFTTWLFGVIRFTALNARRKRLLQSLRFVQLGNSSLRIPQENSIEAKESEPILREALSKLSARQREVLHLVFYQDLTIEESAKIMNISLGSARTHYERGKKKLRQMLSSTELQKKRFS